MTVHNNYCKLKIQLIFGEISCDFVYYSINIRVSPWRGLIIRKLINVDLYKYVKLQPKISNIKVYATYFAYMVKNMFVIRA